MKTLFSNTTKVLSKVTLLTIVAICTNIANADTSKTPTLTPADTNRTLESVLKSGDLALVQAEIKKIEAKIDLSEEREKNGEKLTYAERMEGIKLLKDINKLQDVDFKLTMQNEDKKNAELIKQEEKKNAELIKQEDKKTAEIIKNGLNEIKEIVSKQNN